MSSNQERSGRWNPLEQVVVEITAPFQKVISNTIDATGNIWSKYFHLINTRKENIRLKEEILFLKVENFRHQELIAAYQRLQKVLQSTGKIDQKLVAARVIGKDPSGLFKSIIINKGKSSGLSVNMAVVNEGGVVGKIVSVSKNYSKVLLLIYQNSAVDCLIERSRDFGIVKGLSRDEAVMIMDYVLKSTDIIVGDTLVTSGIGGVFPKGIPVGTITEIKDPTEELFMEVKVAPSVDFSKLEEVLVILMEDPLADR